MPSAFCFLVDGAKINCVARVLVIALVCSLSLAKNVRPDFLRFGLFLDKLLRSIGSLSKV